MSVSALLWLHMPRPAMRLESVWCGGPQIYALSTVTITMGQLTALGTTVLVTRLVTKHVYTQREFAMPQYPIWKVVTLFARRISPYMMRTSRNVLRSVRDASLMETTSNLVRRSPQTNSAINVFVTRLEICPVTELLDAVYIMGRCMKKMKLFTMSQTIWECAILQSASMKQSSIAITLVVQQPHLRQCLPLQKQRR